MSDEKRNMKNELIYDLIFSEKNEFRIKMSEYLDSIYEYEMFIEDITDILIKSKVMITESEVNIESEDIVWVLTVKK